MSSHPSTSLTVGSPQLGAAKDVNRYSSYFGNLNWPQNDKFVESERDTWVLPTALYGKNKLLSQKIDAMVYLDGNWYTTEVFSPADGSGALGVTWNRLIFNPQLATIVPELGTVRLLRSSRIQDSEAFERYGLGFMLEHGFMRTPQGREHYKNTLEQLARSIAETEKLDCIQSLLMCHEKNFQRLEETGTLTPMKVREIKEQELSMWDTLKRHKNSLFLLDTDITEAMTKVGAQTPDTWIVAPEHLNFLSHMPSENTDYYLAGARGQKNLIDGAQSFIPLRGSKVYITRVMKIGAHEPRNPLAHNIQIGSWNPMFCRSSNNAEGYRSWHRDIKLYNEESDIFDKITLTQALLNSNRFDEEGNIREWPQGSDGGYKRYLNSKKDKQGNSYTEEDHYYKYNKKTGNCEPYQLFGERPLKYFTIQHKKRLAQTVLQYLEKNYESLGKIRGIWDAGVDLVNKIEDLKYDQQFATKLDTQSTSTANIKPYKALSTKGVTIKPRTNRRSGITPAFPVDELVATNTAGIDSYVEYIASMATLVPGTQSWPGFKAYQWILDNQASNLVTNTAWTTESKKTLLKQASEFVKLITKLLRHFRKIFPKSYAYEDKFASPWFSNPKPETTFFETVVLKRHRVPLFFNVGARPRLGGNTINLEGTVDISSTENLYDNWAYQLSRQLETQVTLNLTGLPYAHTIGTAKGRASDNITALGINHSHEMIDLIVAQRAVALNATLNLTTKTLGNVNTNLFEYDPSILQQGLLTGPIWLAKGVGAVPRGNTNTRAPLTIKGNSEFAGIKPGDAQTDVFKEVQKKGADRSGYLKGYEKLFLKNAYGPTDQPLTDENTITQLVRRHLVFIALRLYNSDIRNYSETDAVDKDNAEAWLARYKKFAPFFKSISDMTGSFAAISAPLIGIKNKLPAPSKGSIEEDILAVAQRLYSQMTKKGTLVPELEDIQSVQQMVKVIESFVTPYRDAIANALNSNNKAAYPVSTIGTATVKGEKGWFRTNLLASPQFVSSIHDYAQSGNKPIFWPANPDFPSVPMPIGDIGMHASNINNFDRSTHPVFVESHLPEDVYQSSLVSNALHIESEFNATNRSMKDIQSDIPRTPTTSKTNSRGSQQSILIEGQQYEPEYNEEEEYGISAGLNEFGETESIGAHNSGIAIHRLLTLAHRRDMDEKHEHVLKTKELLLSDSFTRSYMETGKVFRDNPFMGSIIRLFDFTPITQQALEIFIENNILYPEHYILARPHKTYRTLWMVRMKRGAAGGFQFYKQPGLFELGDDPRIAAHIGAFFVRSKAVCTRPKNAYLVKTGYVKKYIAGGNTTFIDPAEYAYSALPLNSPSMIALAVPYTHTKRTAFSLIGQGLFRGTRFDLPGHQEPLPGLAYYNMLYGWNEIITAGEYEDGIYVPEGNGQAGVNFECHPGTTLYPDKKNGKFNSVEIGRDHWGEAEYPNCGPAKNARKVTYKKAPWAGYTKI